MAAGSCEAPYVSLIWLNYNSAKILGFVELSLRSLFRLRYPCYEVIVVDNGSTDGSWEHIVEVLGSLEPPPGVAVKTVRLSRNYGFTGGNNAGYRLRSPRARYVALVNNDAVVLPDSLRVMIDCMESSPRVGACQGIVVRPDRRVDSAGGYLDELLHSIHAYSGEPPEAVRRPYYASYAHGAYSVFSVEALAAAGRRDKLFDQAYFAYYEDTTLGLELWQAGYRVKVVPRITAIHIGGASFGSTSSISPRRAYLLLRNRAILNERSNTRFRRLNRLLLLLHALRLRAALLAARTRTPRSLDPVRAVIEGMRIARQAGLSSIDVYRAPLLRLPPGKLLASILLRRVIEDYAKQANPQLLFAAEEPRATTSQGTREPRAAAAPGETCGSTSHTPPATRHDQH